MKGDFGRIRFNRGKHYTTVLQQQGRVALDSDANEQSAIQEYLQRTETVDVVGPFGGPKDNFGFGISAVGNRISIGHGRYYVAGLLCENPSDLLYDEQPYYLNVAESDSNLLHDLLSSGSGASIQVGLQVWQRLVTALDDPCLKEPALGPADTTARLQTVWRVVATLVRPTGTNAGSAPSCCDSLYQLTPPAHTGTLSAQTSGGTSTCGCQPASSAGFRGVENQLYRVEVHQGGDASNATFKWSRENGSVVVAIQSVSGANVMVASLGPDANLGFQPGQWVEISDDTDLFGPTPNQPGQLYQIQSIDAPSLTLTLTRSVLPVDTTRNARLRRWDQTGAGATAAGVALSESFMDLENGIQVRFGEGTYVSGDYWTIPARTATGQIEWPPCGSDGNAFQPPQFVPVNFAPLACIHVRSDQPNCFRVEDCRRRFPTLVELDRPDAPQAMHIIAITWSNDDIMTLDELLDRGLTVTFDQTPDDPVTPATFMVSVEIPIGNQEGLAVAQPAHAAVATPVRAAAVNATPTILRNEMIIDATIELEGQDILWFIPTQGDPGFQPATIFALNDALTNGFQNGGGPGRVRVRIPGRMLPATVGQNRLFLDGQTFAQTAFTADGQRKRINLQLPSGDNVRASDFESWFYLNPALAVNSVQVSFTEIRMGLLPDGELSVGTTPDSTGPLNQMVTIALNFPAPAAATIALTLTIISVIVTDDSGGSISVTATDADRNLATLAQPTVPVNPGDTQAQVKINVSNTPPDAQRTITYIVAASLVGGLGSGITREAEFAIRGVSIIG